MTDTEMTDTDKLTDYNELVKQLTFTISADVITGGDQWERSIAESQFIRATAAIKALQARVVELEAENKLSIIALTRAQGFVDETVKLNAVLDRLRIYHHPDCNWWTWNWKYSWSPSDCTCNQVGDARNRGKKDE